MGREADRVNEMFYTVPLTEAFLNPECLVPGPGDEPVSKKGSVVRPREIRIHENRVLPIARLGPGNRPPDQNQTSPARAG